MSEWLDVAKFAVDIIWKLGSLVAFTGMFVIHRAKAGKQAVEDLRGDVDRRLDDHDNRIIVLETWRENVPTHADLTALRTSVDTLTGASQQLNRQVSMINEHLIRDGK